MAVLCVWGNSIEWGAWDRQKGGWVQRLRLWIDTKNYEVDVYNLGVSGDTTTELLERFECEAKARLPTMIIISIGGNDSGTRDGKKDYLVQPEQFAANLQKIIKLAKNHTQQVALLGLYHFDESKSTPVSWKPHIWYRNTDIDAYGNIVQNIAKESICHFIDMTGVLEKTDFEDGIHPTALGHRKIFKHVKKFLLANKWVENGGN